MEEVEIELPDEMLEWAGKQAEKEGYPTVGDYIVALIRRDLEAHKDDLNRNQIAPE
jgi:Arc/MetJ-type ribon-helix-helix transcriptional regulator